MIKTYPSTAVIALLCSVTCFAMVDGLGKYLVDSYPVAQIAWARNFFFLLALIPLTPPRLWPLMVKTHRPWAIIGRSVLPLATTTLVIVGIRFIPLADATAILFVAPLVMTALSVPLLRERVGIHRWIAVVVGFIGVLIITRPGYGGFGLSAAILVAGACLSALYQLLTRVLRSTETPEAMIFYTALIGTLVAAVALPFDWVTPDLKGWGFLAASGLIYGLGQVLLVKAFSEAEASLLAPFLYAQILGAALIGYLVFGDWPDMVSILGTVIIIIAGLYVAWREQVAAKRGHRLKTAIPGTSK